MNKECKKSKLVKYSAPTISIIAYLTTPLVYGYCRGGQYNQYHLAPVPKAQHPRNISIYGPHTCHTSCTGGDNRQCLGTYADNVPFQRYFPSNQPDYKHLEFFLNTSVKASCQIGYVTYPSDQSWALSCSRLSNIKPSIRHLKLYSKLNFIYAELEALIKTSDNDHIPPIVNNAKILAQVSLNLINSELKKTKGREDIKPEAKLEQNQLTEEQQKVLAEHSALMKETLRQLRQAKKNLKNAEFSNI